MIRDGEIDAQMRRILESPVFTGAARSRQFLQFCVDRARHGDVAHLKETTIAIEVFLRAADYDPKSDPIVRVHARRVREKLDQYYRTAGVDDPIKIDLPKGGYVPHILRTLPRRKTDFADWEEPSTAAFSTAESAGHLLRSTASIPDTSPPKPGKIRRLLITIVLFAVALLGFALAWIWRGQPRSEAASFNTLSPIDSLSGNATDSTWSPDGTTLAVSLTPPDELQPHIYIQNMRSGAPPVRLTEEANPEIRPVWSPNGREIAFIRRLDLSHFDVMRFKLRTKTLAPAGRFISYWPIQDDHPVLDWSPDGKSLLTAEQAVPGNPMRLVLLSLPTGERTYLTSPPIGSSGDIEAKFSPDGQLIAFRRGGLGDLYIVSVQGDEARPSTRLTFDTKGVRGIAWIDHGRSILFGTQRSQTAAYGLWKISRDGGAPQPVTPVDFDAINPTISSIGSVVFEHRQLVTELEEQPLSQSSAKPLASVARALLPSDKTDSAPAYSPDGSAIAFISTRTGWGELWLYRLSDSAPIQLTHFQGEGLVFPPSWSPDGRSIAFSFRKLGATNVMVYDLAQHAIRQLTFTRNRNFNPVFSSDGKYLFFSSNDDGTSRIWRIPVTGGTRAEPLFLETIAGFLPSADGRWLYFLEEGDPLVLARRNLLDGTTQKIFHTTGRPTFVDSLVIAGGRIFLAVSQSDLSASDVFEIDPEKRTSSIVSHLKGLPPLSASSISGYSVSPNGHTLIVDHTIRNTSELYTLRQGLMIPTHP